jgi:antitoxin HicB
MLEYPALFTPEKDAFTITFPDFPEAITCGYSPQEAMSFATDALKSVLEIYMEKRKDIPPPSRAHGKHVQTVRLSALQDAKVSLYQAMRSAGVRKAELARRLGWQKSQIDRLLDLDHASRLDQIEQALEVLGKRLAVEVRDAA